MTRKYRIPPNPPHKRSTLFELYENNGNCSGFWFSRPLTETIDFGFAIYFAGKKQGKVERERTTAGINFGWPNVLAAYFDRDGQFESLRIVRSPSHSMFTLEEEPSWWNKERENELIEQNIGPIEDYLNGDLHARRKNWGHSTCEHGNRATRCRLCYEAGNGWGGSIPGIDARCEHDKLFRNCVICNPQEAIASRLRGRVSSAIKRGKSKSTMELTGCTIEFLISHLEAQFQEGMSLENYGEWHIDHRRPCASFDLEEEEQQMMCFHYTNLQPMWGKENLEKGARFDENKFNWEWNGKEWEPSDPSSIQRD